MAIRYQGRSGRGNPEADWQGMMSQSGSTGLERYEPLLGQLWDYLALSDAPRAADVIFVFGSQDFGVPARAAELYRERHAPRILVTGSFGRMTRDVFEKTEALAFADHLISAGVPEEAILTEPDASNTLENVRFGMGVLRREGLEPRSALLVAKGFVMRRCVATFERQIREVSVRACPPAGGWEAALDRSPREFAVRLVAEIGRLERYASQGDITPQAIPERVRAAATRLAARL